MKIHTGDTVVVIAGKDKDKTGKVLRVLLGQDRVVVAGMNMCTRHVKKTPQRAGQRVRYEASLHMSNVMLVDPKTKKRTRIGFRFVDGKKKERFAKKSGEALVSGKALKKLVGDEEDESEKPEDKAKEKDKEAKKAKKTKKTTSKFKKES